MGQVDSQLTGTSVEGAPESGFGAILKVRGRFDSMVLEDGDYGKQAKGTLKDAVVIQMIADQEPVELTDGSFTFYVGYAAKGKIEPTPQSQWRRHFTKSAEALFEKRGEKGKGWRDLVDTEVTIVRVFDKEREIKDRETGEKKKVTPKSWEFVDEVETAESIDAHVSKLIKGLNKQAALRAVMADARAKKEPRFKDAVKAGADIAGMTIKDEIYVEAS